MTTTPSDIARMLRDQAWQRAKAELQSMLSTFKSSDPENCSPGQYDRLSVAIDRFTADVEKDALNE